MIAFLNKRKPYTTEGKGNVGGRCGIFDLNFKDFYPYCLLGAKRDV